MPGMSLARIAPADRRTDSRLRRFLSAEDGTATVELVVWIPFFLFLFLVLVDASVFYWRYSMMWDTTRDAARELSIGAFANCAGTDHTACAGDVLAYVHGRLGTQFTGTLAPSLTLDRWVTVSTPLSNLTVIGIFNGAIGANTPILTQVRMRDEPL